MKNKFYQIIRFTYIAMFPYFMKDAVYSSKSLNNGSDIQNIKLPKFLSKFSNIFQLMRLDRPIGFILLLMPTAISLIVYSPKEKLYLYLILALVGALFARSAGCIINDIVDRELDAKVERTKHRPIASKAVSLKSAFLLLIVCLAVSFAILMQFHNSAIIAVAIVTPFVFIYPHVKHFTYMAQLFLGLVFGYGVIFGMFAGINHFDSSVLYLYGAVILQVFVYDTIYASIDMEDDRAASVKSSALYFHAQIKEASFALMLLSFMLLWIFFIKISAGFLSLLVLMLAAFSAHYMILQFDISNKDLSLNIFKYSVGYQLLILLALLV